MPFALIPTALGVCFFLVWLFIGGMILRDGRRSADRDDHLDERALPAGPKRNRQAA